MRRLGLVLAAIGAALAVVPSAWAAVRPARSGRLVVVVSGLPAGQRPTGALRGPGVSRAVAAQRVVLPRVRPGRYVLTLRPVRIRRSWRLVAAGAVATPRAARVIVTVRGSRTSTLTAAYGTIVNPRVGPLPVGARGVRGDPASPSALVYPTSGKVPALGSIVLSAPSALLPNGLIARVVGVTRQGPATLVSVTNVPVSQAVPEFSFSGAVDLHPAGDRSSVVARKADTACGGYLSIFDVGASLDQFQIRQASTGLWPPQMSLTLAARTSEHLGNRAFSASVQCAHDLGQIGPTWHGAIPTPVGPIPVYGSVPVTLSGSVSGSGSGFRLDHASTHVITLDLGHRNHFDFAEQGANTWQSGTAGGYTADISLQASLEFGIGDPHVGNLHLDVGFGPHLTIKPSSGCDLELDLGSVSAGVKIGWFGASTPSWTPFHQHLWHGCAPAPGPGTGSSGLGGGPGSPGPGGSGSGGGPGPGTGLAAGISTGTWSTCGLLSDGGIDCWGSNYDGELGDGSTTASNSCAGWPCSPMPVRVNGISSASQVSAGGDFVCALLTGGGVDCWGQQGGLGDGTYTGPDTCADGSSCSTTPVQVSGISDATQVSAGAGSACAVLTGGGLDCWGDNGTGELGNGVPGDSASSVPVQVHGIDNATQVSVGDDFACAVLAGGSVACWGMNADGQLGNGNISGPDSCNDFGITYPCSDVPVQVSGISDAMQVSAGAGSACAVLVDGRVKCWGDNADGALGDGTTGGSDTCGMDNGGGPTVWCSTVPVQVSGISNATQVSVGSFSACSVLSAGAISCWGYNGYGELGDSTNSGPGSCVIGNNGGTEPCSTVPDQIAGMNDATHVSVGGFFACSVLSGGPAECWGENGTAQLGDGTTTERIAPVLVSGLS